MNEGGAASGPRGPSEEANAVVLNYLRRMGYRQTEQLFREEAHVGNLETMTFELRHDQDASISNYLLFSGATEVNASHGIYEQAYHSLKQWCHESLDVYREELSQVLYPIGVHAYLDLVAKGLVGDAEKFMQASLKPDHMAAHGDELGKIEGVRDAQQMKECMVTAAFRTNKYNVTMSGYAFQLLMNFLQESTQTPGNILLLKIINQFVNIRVLVSKGLSAVSCNAGPIGITGLPSQASLTLNRQPLQLGVRPVDPEAEEVLQANKPKDPAGRPIQNDPLTAAIAQYKKNFVNTSQSLMAEGEGVPRPESGAAEIAAEVQRLRELAQRALLSSNQLPSISCFTLHNTYDGITSIDISEDASLLATGNRDSYIDIWSLNGNKLKGVKPSTELAAMDLSSLDDIEGLKEIEGSPTKRLIGHSGPVYSTKFMPPDGKRFMISASQDKTLRLWSLDLFAPIVVYRSHTLPVWDVDVPNFVSAGPYFASASADRTARLWSTEHIHPLRIFAGHLSDVDAVKFHPNGAYLATGSSDKTCRLWDVQTGQCVRLMTGHDRGITALAMSPDGKLLASGDRLGNVILWDLGEGKLLKRLSPPSSSMATPKTGPSAMLAIPESPVHALTFCQDGKVLAQTGASPVVHLWDATKATSTAATGNDLLLSSFPTKQTPLFTAKFSRKNVLLTAGVYQPE